MRVRVSVCVAAIVALSVALAAAAPGQSPIGTRHSPIDNVFAPWDRKDSPGGALGVFRRSTSTRPDDHFTGVVIAIIDVPSASAA